MRSQERAVRPQELVDRSRVELERARGDLFGGRPLGPAPSQVPAAAPSAAPAVPAITPSAAPVVPAASPERGGGGGGEALAERVAAIVLERLSADRASAAAAGPPTPAPAPAPAEPPPIDRVQREGGGQQSQRDAGGLGPAEEGELRRMPVRLKAKEAEAQPLKKELTANRTALLEKQALLSNFRKALQDIDPSLW